jgi:hypothetical protein
MSRGTQGIVDNCAGVISKPGQPEQPILRPPACNSYAECMEDIQ